MTLGGGNAPQIGMRMALGEQAACRSLENPTQAFFGTIRDQQGESPVAHTGYPRYFTAAMSRALAAHGFRAADRAEAQRGM